MAQRVILRERLAALARESVAALGGERLVREALAESSREALADFFSYDEVWAVGKAAAAMARGAGFSRGLILTKDGAAGESGAWEAAHPIPDERGVAATLALLARARALSADARVLLCLSGGASALLAAPVDGVTLGAVQSATRVLLGAGAPIGEINVVRRHLGAALGGKLAAATRARLDVLALSDVVGDDPAAIGSGPASADASTLDDALAIARARGLPADVIAALQQNAPETLKPGDPRLARVSYRMLASPLTLRDEAARRAREFSVRLRPSLVTGPVEDLAQEMAALQLAPGELWVAVGEPTVSVRGAGRGGRAQHLALLLARALQSSPDTAFVALGSDGSDGPTAAAGAAVDGDTWRAAIDPEGALARFDSHTLLDAAGATLVTGPTGTNLTDLLLLARAPRT